MEVYTQVLEMQIPRSYIEFEKNIQAWEMVEECTRITKDNSSDLPNAFITIY